MAAAAAAPVFVVRIHINSMAIVYNLHHKILRARANDSLMTYFYAIIIIIRLLVRGFVRS